MAVVVAGCVLGAVAGAAPAAEAAEADAVVESSDLPETLTKQERINLLRAREAKLRLEQARSEMESAGDDLGETEALFRKHIVTIEEKKKYEQAARRAELAYEEAQIELEKVRLDFLKDATLITVVEATKRRTPEGLYMVDVVLRNDSDLSKARFAMAKEAEAGDAAVAALLDIDNVIVSLTGRSLYKDEEGVPTRSEEAIIGDPYQQIVPILKHAESRTLTFKLLMKDVDTLTVGLAYLGLEKQFPVFLKMEAGEDFPTIAAVPFAQQGRLGTKVYYNLELERLATSERSFAPVVLNLPLSIPFAFLDPLSDARVTQIRFTPESSKQTLRFEVSVPEKLDKQLVDKSISFEIIITHPSKLQQINQLKSAHLEDAIPAEAMHEIKGSRASLILIPQGVGKLDTLIANSFMEISQGKEAKFKFTIYNSGTLALRKVTPKVDPPLEWVGTLEPKTAAVIEPDEKLMFIYTAEPPPDVAIGEYTLQIDCEAYSGVETIEAIRQDFTVRIVAQRSITGMAVLVGVLVLIVLIIAIASVKIARR